MIVQIVTILLMLVSLSASQTDISGKTSKDFRIIDGKPTGRCRYPWMALIFDRSINQLCGGSIIDSTYILTAAHCVVSNDNVTKAQVVSPAAKVFVYTGSTTAGYIPGSDAIKRSVANVTPHELYTGTVNDIAILTLSDPISFNTCHSPISLVNASSSPTVGGTCTVLGWGVTSNAVNASSQTELLKADATVVSDVQCKKYYGGIFKESLFCAGSTGPGICRGDSGGPLVCIEKDKKKYLHGVVSRAVLGRCGSTPGLYTKVSSFIPWIQKQLNTTGQN